MKCIRDVLSLSDVSEEPLWRVAFNVSAMQFLTAVVNCDLCALTPDLWDFILCSAVSWIGVRIVMTFTFLKINVAIQNKQLNTIE